MKYTAYENVNYILQLNYFDARLIFVLADQETKRLPAPKIFPPSNCTSCHERTGWYSRISNFHKSVKSARLNLDGHNTPSANASLDKTIPKFQVTRDQNKQVRNRNGDKSLWRFRPKFRFTRMHYINSLSLSYKFFNHFHL